MSELQAVDLIVQRVESGELTQDEGRAYLNVVVDQVLAGHPNWQPEFWPRFVKAVDAAQRCVGLIDE